MKAVQISRYGGSDVVEIKQNAPFPSAPKPLPDKILVGIKAAGVNPVDWKIREGHMQQMMNPKFPLTLGMDFSGVVQQMGEGGGEKLPAVLGKVMRCMARLQFQAEALERLRKWPLQMLTVLRPSPKA